MICKFFKFAIALTLALGLIFGGTTEGTAFAHSFFSRDIHIETRDRPEPKETKVTPLEFAHQIQVRLNSHREQIGRNAFSIVHPNGSYDRTGAILVAERDGGGWVFEIPIRWQRKLGFVSRNHITRIDWEIYEGHHVTARVVYDDSHFPPTHLDRLNDYFQMLLSENT
ncbi:hypothetical protein [Baaleninema sp.]|uniref:hypothetical protein n=1 Tax=Baaleninema sp. TaxID=3101197 RepID=UPI003D05F09D